ncbi:MAG: nuclear transport factor 2 family protein [Rubrivivax sp.]|nr:nuclear transport factor 2 family protein [Rubrivivax sp.]
MNPIESDARRPSRRTFALAAGTLAAAAVTATATATAWANPAATQSPESVALAFARAFNARDLDALLALYPAGSVFVPAPGQALTTRDAIRQALQGFLAIGLPIAMTVRHVYGAGDTALLVVDWTIRGTGADGRSVDLSGTGTDVVRRDADGLWRYAVDNPFGGLKPSA